MNVEDRKLRVLAYAGSDIGLVRRGNEDSYLAGSTVFAVADGMGGHVAGEVASATALAPLERLDGEGFHSADAAEEALVAALEAANRDVVEKATADPRFRGMGTTLTAVLVREDRLHVAHVGDSRAYLLRSDEPISQLTTDHTLVERLVRDGRLSREEAARHPKRNVITRAIGQDPDVQVDLLPPLILQPDDQVLLCSDGLTGQVDDERIAAILRESPDGEQAVAELIDAANAAGGPDNITVVLLRVVGAGTVPPDDAHLMRIRTREEHTDGDWARDFGRLADTQGVDRPSTSRTAPPSRSRRILAGVLATAVLLAVIAGGGWFVLSRAFFVSAHEGRVAIYNGLNVEVLGAPLYRLLPDEVSTVAMSDFPEFRQEEIRAGLNAGTLSEARRIVEQLGLEAEELAETTPTEQPTRPRRQQRQQQRQRDEPQPTPRARP